MYAVRGEVNSNKAIHFSNQNTDYLCDPRKLRKRPSWLTGVPTIVNLESKEVFEGTRCLLFMQSRAMRAHGVSSLEDSKKEAFDEKKEQVEQKQEQEELETQEKKNGSSNQSKHDQQQIDEKCTTDESRNETKSENINTNSEVTGIQEKPEDKEFKSDSDVGVIFINNDTSEGITLEDISSETPVPLATFEITPSIFLL